MRNLIFIFGILLGLSSCEKGPGEGGTSVIEGKVYILDLYQNSSTGTWDTMDNGYYLASEQEVYIIYSGDENDIYDDSFDTHWNGEYRFEYLRKGDYTVFTYAKLDTSGTYTGDFPIVQHVTIDENNKAYTLDDFIVIK